MLLSLVVFDVGYFSLELDNDCLDSGEFVQKLDDCRHEGNEDRKGEYYEFECEKHKTLSKHIPLRGGRVVEKGRALSASHTGGGGGVRALETRGRVDRGRGRGCFLSIPPLPGFSVYPLPPAIWPWGKGQCETEVPSVRPPR